MTEFLSIREALKEVSDVTRRATRGRAGGMSAIHEQICPSMWHDEAHSEHSSCGQCGGKGNRAHVLSLRDKSRENFEWQAAKWAREHE